MVKAPSAIPGRRVERLVQGSCGSDVLVIDSNDLLVDKETMFHQGLLVLRL